MVCCSKKFLRFGGGAPLVMIYTLTRDDIPLLSQWIKNRQVETCRFLKTNPYFDTNAPPFEVRGCRVVLGGAFLGQGGAKNNS